MKIRNLSHQLKAVLLILLFLVGLSGPAVADPLPLDDVEDVPATAAEVRFTNRVIDQIKTSVPLLDGWNLNVRAYASDNRVRKGEPVMIFPRTRDFPLEINIRFIFKKITAAQKKKKAAEKSAQELQQEMMTATMSGDTQRMEQIQQQLAAMMQSQMTAGPMGQAVGASPMVAEEKPTKFQVQVIVNGEGEHIGKKYDITVPGTARAFRVDRDIKELLSYKYYLGAWKVSELDARNWNIASPAADQTPDNHLRALVLFANVFGDRNSVEEYVKNHLDLEGLKKVLD